MRELPCRRCLGLLALVILAACFSLPALGFQAISQNQMYEIPLPAFFPVSAKAFPFAGRQQAVTEALGSRYGGQWRVFSFNGRSGTPHYIYGNGASLVSAITGPADLEQLARRILTDNRAVLQADPDQLVLRAAPHAKGKWVAHFQQTYHGLPVWEGKALVAFSEDGRLVLLGSDYYGGIEVDSVPSLSPAVAEQIARADLPFDPATDRVEDGTTLLVLPYPLSATDVDPRLVYRVRVRTADPLGIWVTHVDAHSGQILWRYNDIHFDFGGGTSSDVREDTYCNGATQQAMPYLRITVGGLGQVISDANGDWNIAGSGGPRSVTADLYGPYADLFNSGGAEAQYSGSAEDGVPLTVSFNDLNSQKDERDVFDAVNDLHDFFEQFAPSFSYTDQRINAYVSNTGGICPGNAWWDGTINFCAAGGSYANTGEIQGVAHHEFGHGVQDAILGWQGNEGLGEGNGDILANLMTQEAEIGRGFFVGNCTSGIRSSDNTLIYPDDVVGQEIHSAGRVIAGFHWDAMVLLQAALGTEQGTLVAASDWHFGRVLMLPTSQPDQVFATFFADDDDGNLDNGTPHHQYLCEAAQNHNFNCPEILTGVLFSHQPLTDTVDPLSSNLVQATIYSTEAELDPATIKLFWRRSGGAWNEVLMTDLGGDQYEAEIPAGGLGEVDYYLYAEDTVGNIGSDPADAPAGFFSFLVASSIDALEAPSGWTAGDVDDDATTGLWERVDPIATSAQPEDDHTVDGTLCWITGQHQIGQGDGYNDVDGGKTTLFTPVYDLSTYDEAIFKYWKWYSNDRGASPNSDWWDVMVSNDGGATWTAVEHTMSSTNAWVAVTFNLSNYFPAPDQVQLKFIAADEGSGSLVEAGIDDLTLVALSAATGVGNGDSGLAVRLVTALDQNSPNPFNPRTEISFSLQKAGRASLRVYDLQGRLVRTLVAGELPAGPQQVVWDGTRGDGRPVASGVYFYKLEADGGVFSKRMLLVK